MRARKDESIWSTDAAAGHCRPVIVFAETRSRVSASGKADAGKGLGQPGRPVQRVPTYLCVVLGTALGYLCGYLWRVL
jgi:hypothetical protein